MKNILLIAPPAAGKGTQAKLISEYYHIPHISTGDLLRDAKDNNHPLADIIREKQNKGEFVPDSIVLDLLKERLNQTDCNHGYILDGFPRNIEQAYAYEHILSELGKELGVVILLDLDKDIAKKRITGRYSCPQCGAIYNTEIADLNPQQSNICDKCQTELFHRDDDNENTYDVRYNAYIEKTAPLIDYYQKKGILKRIDSNQDSKLVFKLIKEIIQEI